MAGNVGPHGARLASFVERIERLNEERKSTQGDIGEVFAEAKSAGFDVKTIREVLKLRAMDAADRQERQALLETYMHALGMLADLPLGKAALDKVA